MATELAQAYVQIIPSAKGIAGSISNVLSGEADSAGLKAGTSIAGKMVKAIKAGLAAAGISKMVQMALTEGGALQQAIGGIETLFGAGGDSIEEYAAKQGKAVADVVDEYNALTRAESLATKNAQIAWKTAGLSTNEYMTQITSFAAALKRSTKSEEDAARVADMAVIDMADNANKMGTSMEDIQHAYQGFAKQNYTINNLMSVA